MGNVLFLSFASAFYLYSYYDFVAHWSNACQGTELLFYVSLSKFKLSSIHISETGSKAQHSVGKAGSPGTPKKPYMSEENSRAKNKNSNNDAPFHQA